MLLVFSLLKNIKIIIMIKSSFKGRSIRKAITISGLSLVLCGCANLVHTQKDTQSNIDVTELGLYWVVKDGVLDWSVFSDDEVQHSFTAQFTINPEGKIEALKLSENQAGFNPSESQIAEFPKQEFNATTANYEKQAVTVSMFIGQD
ncbi:hypothetical protein [Shewanella woodyi]|uniref:Uncharacterized protein n=1 Tax=Shewanella woodyi (strain ATCC 51908 / MS32) TaxID=392500 RepID=B1KPD6_SHEWM|nr:hypothetical protein [Shewanella woodyi]ACA84706.1 hypothetical protein Swoo_0407 [Shewanella woodyi ATCC 51908]